MTDEPLGSERVQRCILCSGVFVAGHVIKEIRAHAALQFHQISSRPAQAEPARVSCPSDATQMLALTYQSVEIDVCPSCHGVWLDAGELEKISKAVRIANRHDLTKTNSKLEEIDGNLDLVDTLTDIDLGGLGDVVGFVGDALGSLFDGISFPD